MNFRSTDPTISLIEDYYNHFNEDDRLLKRHGQVEFLTTVKYIDQILSNDKNKKIIDIGAGTGRYSIYFHDKGYDVTAIELVKKNIDVFKTKNSCVPIYQANALDLSFIKDESYDVTLLFGPMYHLLNENDKIQALKEAKRITKKDGYIFISYYMNEYAILEYGFVKGHILESISEGRVDDSFHMINKNDDLYSMVRIEDMDRFNHHLKLKSIQRIAQDGASDYMRNAINRLSEEEFKEYIRYHLSICERKELLGASSHVLDILIKE